MDLLALYEGAWFGKPLPQDLDSDSVLDAAEQSLLRRGSAGSLSDGAANEQADGKAAGREQPSRRRQQQQSGQQAVRGGYRAANGLLEEEDGGVLGTWAGRQRIFSDHLRQQEQEQEQQRQRAVAAERPPIPVPPATDPGNAHAPDAVHGESPPPAAPVDAPGAQQAEAPHETSLDQELNAAWRWRFTRKWQAEQMKQFEPAPPPGPNGGIAEGEDEEEWTAALRLMDAVDGGLNMQIGRTLSLHNSSMMESSADHSLTLMSPGLSQVLLMDSSIKESPLREESAAATNQIVSVARKAQHLRRHQQEIERQVNERWEAASSGGPWVAQHLPAVQLDSWSSFVFVLVRLTEQRSQRQKLLVRGRNGATEQHTFATTEQEAARAAIAHRLPGPRVELVATGRMEWVAATPAQRRKLRIRATRLLPPAAKDSRLRTAASTSSVVAELVRASFPSGDFDISSEEATPAPPAL